MTGREGTRGGSTGVQTADDAVKLLARWRGEEMGWVRARIVQTARIRGEYHADDLAGVELAQPNVIGAAVRSLLTAGLIASTGERRRNEAAAAHGRRSDVYGLTERGGIVAEALRRQIDDRMPAPHPAGERARETRPAAAAPPGPVLPPAAAPALPAAAAPAAPAPAPEPEQSSLFDLPETPTASPLSPTSPYAN